MEARSTMLLLSALLAISYALPARAQTVGKALVYLTGPTGEPNSRDAAITDVCGRQETNLGDLVAEALLANYKGKLPASINSLPVVALVNGGGFGASIPKGDITQAALKKVLPFPDTAVVKRVSATALKDALNSGFSTWNPLTALQLSKDGRFPQVAGIKIVFDPTAPTKTRLVSATLANGKDLGTYKGDIALVTNNYIGLVGGDGYTMIKSAPTVLSKSEKVIDILTKFIGGLPKKEVKTTTDNRIINCIKNYDAKACTAFGGKAIGAKKPSVYLTGTIGEPNTADAKISKVCWRQETNFGNLHGDGLIWYFNKNLKALLAAADQKLPVVSLVNGGGIATSVPKDTTLTNAVVKAVNPYDDWIVVKKISAANLIAALNGGLAGWDPSKDITSGGFPQVGGFKLTFSASTKKVVQATLANSKVLGKDYTGDVVIVTNNYISLPATAQFDGYTELGKATTLLSNAGHSFYKFLTEYLASLPAISPKVEGRVVRTA